MRTWTNSFTTGLATVAMWSGLATPIHAQWLHYPSKGIPRSANGKPDLNAPAPRTADNKPDLSGIWQAAQTPRYLFNIAADLKPAEVPFQPWAEALYQERSETNGKDHPGAQCLPSGIPEKDAVPDPFKILQTPDLVVILYESRTIYRQIFTDGRPFPVDPQPSWMGYSVGRWEKDALVVETTGFNGKTWLDMSGHPATDALRVTERFSRRDFGNIDLQITIDDPKAYTKPWSVTEALRLVPDTELVEYICEENNRDPGHMVGK